MGLIKDLYYKHGDTSECAEAKAARKEAEQVTGAYLPGNDNMSVKICEACCAYEAQGFVKGYQFAMKLQLESAVYANLPLVLES